MKQLSNIYKIATKKMIFLIFLVVIFFNGCYSIEQSYGQIKLLLSQKKITDVVEKYKNNPDYYKKLTLVEPILQYAAKDLHLITKNSYKKFVELDSSYVTWVVQASEKRKLKLKTWWFPLIGEQPYLGFFEKEKAFSEAKKLKADGYDVAVGGVKAFSLLGYYPDPLYSSMLDDVTLINFIETLLHEIVHKTIYIQNNYSFNENLANFIARKGTSNFIKIHPELSLNVNNYENLYIKKSYVQNKFSKFVVIAKKQLNEFYNLAGLNLEYNDDKAFLIAREKEFDKLCAAYQEFMNGDEINSNYQYAFTKGNFNNAVLFSYSIYEEDQKFLDGLYLKANSSVPVMIDKLKQCSYLKDLNAKSIYDVIPLCF